MKQFCRFQTGLCVSGIPLTLDSEINFDQSERFLPFITDADSPSAYRVHFFRTGELPKFSGQIVSRQTSYDVIADREKGYIRTFRIENPEATPYAVGQYDWEKREITLFYLSEGARYFSGIENSFLHIAWESIVTYERRLLFHAALVKTAFGGILFSGPSGIGKSTQADLWCRCRDAKLINGDRPILQKTETGWIGWGAPYAGSSHCYLNESCPICAIILLRQAPQCSIRTLGPAEAFRYVYAQLTLNSWDRICVGIAADLVAELMENVPVFEFGCTPNETAVAFLEKELGRVLT